MARHHTSHRCGLEPPCCLAFEEHINPPGFGDFRVPSNFGCSIVQQLWPSFALVLSFTPDSCCPDLPVANSSSHQLCIHHHLALGHIAPEYTPCCTSLFCTPSSSEERHAPHPSMQQPVSMARAEAAEASAVTGKFPSTLPSLTTLD